MAHTLEQNLDINLLTWNSDRLETDIPNRLCWSQFQVISLKWPKGVE